MDVFVGRKDRIELFHNLSVLRNERNTLDQTHALDVEHRQPKSLSEGERAIAQQLERKVQSLGSLSLTLGGLSAQPKHLSFQRLQLTVVIAEGTRLRRATSRARDLIPSDSDKCEMSKSSFDVRSS